MNPQISKPRKTFILNSKFAYYFGLADPSSVKTLGWKKLIKVNLLADSGGAPVNCAAQQKKIGLLHGNYLWQRIPLNFDIEFPEIWRLYPNWGYRKSPDRERTTPRDTEQIYAVERLQYCYEEVRGDRKRRNESSHLKTDTAVLRLLAIHHMLTDWEIAKKLRRHVRVIRGSVDRLVELELLFLFEPKKGPRATSLRYRDDGIFYYFSRYPDRISHLRRWNLEGHEPWTGTPGRFRSARSVEDNGGDYWVDDEYETDRIALTAMPKFEGTKQLCLAIYKADQAKRVFNSPASTAAPLLYSKNGLYKLTNFYRPKFERALAEAVDLKIVEVIDGKFRHSLYKSTFHSSSMILLAANPRY
jgi:hypothetical protein